MTRNDNPRGQVDHKKVLKWSLIIFGPIIVFLIARPYIFPPESPLAMHMHEQLDYYVNGVQSEVPKDIGIRDDLYWHDHSLDNLGWGGQAPLHTHDVSGLIHIESVKLNTFTLGQFLDIWGVDLQGKQVSFCEYASLTTGGHSDTCTPITDYRNYTLIDGGKIKLEVDN